RPRVVPAHAVQEFTTRHLAGVNAAGPYQGVEVEFTNPEGPVSSAELEPVTVNNTGRRFGVEHLNGRLDEDRREAVVGIEREDIAPTRLADSAVARRSEPTVRLVDDAIACLPQNIEHLESARLRRSIIDHH